MLLSRLSVSPKLAITGLVFTIPIVVMGFIILQGIQYDLPFTAKEAHGVEYLRTLVSLYADVPSYARSAGAGNPGTAGAALAMNASIEAAHAGAAGKGFAVVGNLSKELADRVGSAEISLDRISATIGRIADGMAETVDKMGRYGSLIADSRGDADKLRDFSSAIREAVEEQDTGSKEIVRAIQEPRDTSLRNAESSKVLADLSDALRSESRELDLEVKTFALDEAGA